MCMPEADAGASALRSSALAACRLGRKALTRSRRWLLPGADVGPGGRGCRFPLTSLAFVLTSHLLSARRHHRVTTQPNLSRRARMPAPRRSALPSMLHLGGRQLRAPGARGRGPAWGAPCCGGWRLFPVPPGLPLTWLCLLSTERRAVEPGTTLAAVSRPGRWGPPAVSDR